MSAEGEAGEDVPRHITASRAEAPDIQPENPLAAAPAPGGSPGRLSDERTTPSGGKSGPSERRAAQTRQMIRAATLCTSADPRFPKLIDDSGALRRAQYFQAGLFWYDLPAIEACFVQHETANEPLRFLSYCAFVAVVCVFFISFASSVRIRAVSAIALGVHIVGGALDAAALQLGGSSPTTIVAQLREANGATVLLCVGGCIGYLYGVAPSECEYFLSFEGRSAAAPCPFRLYALFFFGAMGPLIVGRPRFVASCFMLITMFIVPASMKLADSSDDALPLAISGVFVLGVALIKFLDERQHRRRFEQLVERDERTAMMHAQQAEFVRFVNDITPEHLRSRLSSTEPVTVDMSDSAIVLLVDVENIIGFMHSMLPTKAALEVGLLSAHCTALPRHFGMHHIRSIGDVSIIVSNLFVDQQEESTVSSAVDLGLHLQRITTINFRCGVAVGSLMGMPLGTSCIRYDVMGAALRKAELLAATCPPRCVQVAKDAFASLRVSLPLVAAGSRDGADDGLAAASSASSTVSPTPSPHTSRAGRQYLTREAHSHRGSIDARLQQLEAASIPAVGGGGASGSVGQRSVATADSSGHESVGCSPSSRGSTGGSLSSHGVIVVDVVDSFSRRLGEQRPGEPGESEGNRSDKRVSEDPSGAAAAEQGGGNAPGSEDIDRGRISKRVISLQPRNGERLLQVSSYLCGLAEYFTCPLTEAEFHRRNGRHLHRLFVAATAMHAAMCVLLFLSLLLDHSQDPDGIMITALIVMPCGALAYAVVSARAAFFSEDGGIGSVDTILMYIAALLTQFSATLSRPAMIGEDTAYLYCAFSATFHFSGAAIPQAIAAQVSFFVIYFISTVAYRPVLVQTTTLLTIPVLVMSLQLVFTRDYFFRRKFLAAKESDRAAAEVREDRKLRDAVLEALVPRQLVSLTLDPARCRFQSGSSHLQTWQTTDTVVVHISFHYHLGPVAPRRPSTMSRAEAEAGASVRSTPHSMRSRHSVIVPGRPAEEGGEAEVVDPLEWIERAEASSGRIECALRAATDSKVLDVVKSFGSSVVIAGPLREIADARERDATCLHAIRDALVLLERLMADASLEFTAAVALESVVNVLRLGAYPSFDMFGTADAMARALVAEVPVAGMVVATEKAGVMYQRECAPVEQLVLHGPDRWRVKGIGSANVFRLSTSARPHPLAAVPPARGAGSPSLNPSP